MAKVGLLGGTFNPPHIAHLICAQEARLALGLERVLLVPAADPPHKGVEEDPGIAHRLAMCDLAVADDDLIGVSRADVQGTGPSFTVDLLRSLRRASPQDELSFILGGDQARAFPSWREPEQVLTMARLAVVERAEVRRADIAERLASIPGALQRVDFFEMPRIDLSSSDLRRRVAAGLPTRYLVPEPVGEYMIGEGLYTLSDTDER